MFNVIDLRTGWKVDMIIRRLRPISEEEFGRRIQIDLQGVPVFIATAEDIVISKLEWSKMGQSQRQIEDAAAVLKARWVELDSAYLKRWILELGLTKEWQDAGRLAGILD